MSKDTGIEWCDHTFNPWWGCTKVSPACTSCYAEEFANRFPKTRGLWGPSAARKIASEKVWSDPQKWNEAGFGLPPDVVVMSVEPFLFMDAPEDA